MIKRFQTSVVRWFNKSARDLPWRKTSDPYRIWIAEIMLQQTGVSTVIPYYNRFLKRFPKIENLASAEEMEVLKYWEGLGYYRRAKNLRLGAKLIVEKFGGHFPKSKEALLEVPGIGQYTAGAILSIAFRQRAAALDGNLIRVYSRYYSIEEFVDEGSTLKKLWEIAEAHSVEQADSAREFCEGMMELGATICTPHQPKCGECPVQWGCQAFKKAVQLELPRKKPSKVREKYIERVFIHEKNGKFAFFKKGADKKFPDFLRLPFKSAAHVSARDSVLNSKLKTFKYSVTHRDFLVYTERKVIRSKNIEWVSKSDLTKILLPAIDRKILNAYTKL